MKIILLSGGSGKRLWPLSNDARSKQFLKVLQNEEGGSESMIQRIFRQLGKSCPDTEIILATSEVQSASWETRLKRFWSRPGAIPIRRFCCQAPICSIASRRRMMRLL